jgi:hypothetical protein
VEDVAALARVIGEHLGHRDDLVGRAEAGAALVAERYDVALAARAHLDLLSQLGKVPAPR